MKKFRRIEVNAYRRRVRVVSGEWRPGNLFDQPVAPAEDNISLNDADRCEPVAPDSPEGQLILVEAVRTLEQRLSPEARVLIGNEQKRLARDDSRRYGFHLKLQSIFQFIWSKASGFAR